MRRLLFVFVFLALAAWMVWVGVSAQSPSNQLNVPLVYTSAAQYDADAWLRGGERFPAGAHLMVHDGGTSRAVVAGFAATADANVSFDGTRILFAGKREAKDRWQIWEVAVEWRRGEARHCMRRGMRTSVLSSRKPAGVCAQGQRPFCCSRLRRWRAEPRCN